MTDHVLAVARYERRDLKLSHPMAALTRLLAQPRTHPNEAGRIIRENIVRHSTIVPAGEAEYLQALAELQARICSP